MAPQRRPRPKYPEWFERRIGRYTLSNSWKPSGRNWDDDLSDYEPPVKKDRGPAQKKMKFNDKEDPPLPNEDGTSDNEDDAEENEDYSEDDDYYSEDESEDNCSEISNPDSLIEIYREFKMSRNERKKELHDIVSNVMKIENEADEAHQEFANALKMGKSYPMPSLHQTSYHFYSRDQHKYVTCIIGAPKVIFSHYPKDEYQRISGSLPPDYDERVVSGQLYIDADSGCEFKFLPPAELSDAEFSVRDDETGRYELRFQFLSERHIKLSLSKDMLMCDKKAVDAYAPDIIEWVGVRETYEERKAARWDELSEAARKRRARSSSDCW